MTQASSNEHSAPAATTSNSLLASLRAKLETPSAPLVLGGLALIMSLPSLGFGLMTDDHMHADSFGKGLGPLEMLQLPAAEFQRMLQSGEFTWWTSPDLTIRFLRPLSSVTHWIEFTLWPNAAWAMHLTNMLCYALLVAIAALTYRELSGNGRIAGLAALMYAVDDGHAYAVGWISSRNTLLAALFAQLAILLHVRGRKLERWSLVIASAVSSALALLSAEYGVAVFAYVFAYAWLLDSGSLAARARSLAPQVLVGLVWTAVYATGHYGLKHSGWYRDPSGQPVETLLQGLLDLPLWCFSQFGLNVGEVSQRAQLRRDGARSHGRRPALTRSFRVSHAARERPAHLAGVARRESRTVPTTGDRNVGEGARRVTVRSACHGAGELVARNPHSRSRITWSDDRAAADGRQLSPTSTGRRCRCSDRSTGCDTGWRLLCSGERNRRRPGGTGSTEPRRSRSG